MLESGDVILTKADKTGSMLLRVKNPKRRPGAGWAQHARADTVDNLLSATDICGLYHVASLVGRDLVDHL